MTFIERQIGGFTLAEALVALALTAMLAVLGLEASAWLIQARKAIMTSDTAAAVDAAASLMARELAMAQPLFLRGQDGGAVPVFRGIKRSITFALLADGRREPGGFHIVTYRLDGSGELISERRLARTDRSAAPTFVRLMSGVTSLSFLYQDDDHWTNRTDLPLAVSFQITLEPPGGKRRKTVSLKFGGAHHPRASIMPDD